MRTFDTPAPITAVLNIPAGRLQVTATDRTDTTVEIAPADPAKTRDVKAAEQATVTYTDGVLRIEAATAKNQYLGPSGALEVTVQLPSASSVETTSSCIGFQTVGRLGDLVCEGVDGTDATVSVDEAASLRLTAFGEVTVNRLTGPEQISTHKGDITAHNL